MHAYERIRVIGQGSYGSAILVRARAPPLDAAPAFDASGAAAVHPPATPTAPPPERLFVIKQIRLAALEQDLEQHGAASAAAAVVAGSAAAAPGGPAVTAGAAQAIPPNAAAGGGAGGGTGGGGGGGGGGPAPLASLHANLIREVQILMRVGQGHPNICRYRDSFLHPPLSEPVEPSDGMSKKQQRNCNRDCDGNGDCDDGPPPRDRLLCIVMDYYAGGDLSRKIRRLRQRVAAGATNESMGSSACSVSSAASAAPGRPQPPVALFTEDTVLDYLVQLCLGLKHCHDRRVLHRDLKTSNLFLSLERPRSYHRPLPSPSGASSSRPHGAVEVLRIGDFGIARLLDSPNSLARTRIGTPYSLAPEVCEGRPYSFEADVWSLGCVLFELLTGRHAFNAPNLGQLVVAITRGPYAPIPSVYSPRMHLLLQALLQKDPEQRPTVSQLLQLPFLRERIPRWMSHRRILHEFGGELSSLPEFRLPPVFHPPSASHGLNANAAAPSKDVRQSYSASAASASPSGTAAAAPDFAVERSSKPGPPSSLVIPRSMLASAATATATAGTSGLESVTPSPMAQSHTQVQLEARGQSRVALTASVSSLLDRVTVLHTPRPQLPPPQRQPLTPPTSGSSSRGSARDWRHPHHPSAYFTPRAISSTASAAGSSGGEGASASRVTTPTSASVVSSSGGHSRGHSSSTPSPLPALRLYPLALTPLPPPARPSTPAVAPNSIDHPSASTSASASLSSPADPLVTVPSSLSSFAWRVPSSLASALAPAAPHASASASASASAAPAPACAPASSLSLQCERVRAWLEDQIPFATLKRAYDLMRDQPADRDAVHQSTASDGQTASASSSSSSSSSPHAPDARVLQVLHLGQTRLITLMQQLIEAERVQEAEG